MHSLILSTWSPLTNLVCSIIEVQLWDPYEARERDIETWPESCRNIDMVVMFLVYLILDMSNVFFKKIILIFVIFQKERLQVKVLLL